jgi:hypothetical protein
MKGTKIRYYKKNVNFWLRKYNVFGIKKCENSNAIIRVLKKINFMIELRRK